MAKRLFFPFLALLLFLQLSAAAHAADGIQLNVSLTSYQSDVTGNYVPVTAYVQSSSPIRSVKASLDSVEIELKVCEYQGPYCGQIPLDNISYGEKTVTVTAEDSEGRTATASATFWHDRLNVMEPQDRSVITDGKLHLRISSLGGTQDSRIRAMITNARGNQIASVEGSDPIDQWVDIPGTGLLELQLDADLWDSTGQRTAWYQSKLYVNNNPRLQPVFSITDPGAYDIVAYDETRAIARSGGKVYQFSRATGQKTEIPNAPIDSRYGGGFYLTPAGLLFHNVDPYDGDRTYFWNGTGLQVLPDPIESDVYTKGNYVLYSSGEYGNQWVWMNLQNGQTRRYSLSTFSSAGLEDNGDLLMVQNDVIKRFKQDGSEEVVLAGQDRAEKLSADGSRVLFKKDGLLYAYEAGALKRLTDSSVGDYKAAGGWTAYTQYEEGRYHLFLRSPQDEVKQIQSYEREDEYLNGHLQPNGELLVFHNGATLVRGFGEEPQVIDSSIYPQQIRNLNGKWYRGLGRTVFEIRTGAEDKEPPLWPSADALTVSEVTYDSAVLQWQPAVDQAGVKEYHVYQGAALLGSVEGTVNRYRVTGLEAATAYAFRIEAEDAAGNRSLQNPEVQVTTAGHPAGDTTAPEWPSGGSVLTVQDVTYNRLNLVWQPAFDQEGVTAYRIYGSSELLDTVSGDVYSYAVTGLAPDTRYEFAVRAVDGAGNASAGAAVSVTTAAYGLHPEAGVLSLHLGPGFPAKGSPVEVSVKAEKAEDLYAFLLKLQYDRTLLKLNSVQLHKEFGKEKTEAVLASTGLQAETVGLTGSLLGNVPGKSGSSGLLTLKFTALQNGAAQVTVASSSLSDSKGNVRQVTPPAALTVYIGRGDLDNDGVIGLSDLVLISLAHGTVKGQPGYLPQYDLNNDARVDVTDVQYIAGKVAAGA
ncbi:MULTISPECIES: fibronectin type III domain-containing protein [Paenibacillus]|uniref:fibronectin type III domain-containing protein n=1 Tax=Paenibacillus TaxID=44249 RepID=UPI0022B8E498|nr:fibronectin type III domain-containing protein [Paenibacillus caseinilyticus]MCZ8518235.1 fibronectin type III domain-containing protein [Paenibacillus caseinilyticus]